MFLIFGRGGAEIVVAAAGVSFMQFAVDGVLRSCFKCRRISCLETRFLSKRIPRAVIF